MNWKDLRRKLQSMDADDVLEKIGLETRRTKPEKVLPGIVLFGAGLIVGAGLVALLTPRLGSNLRSQLKTQWGNESCCEHGTQHSDE